MTKPISQEDLQSFSAYLKSSTRILALCGAGLSASSGLPTFRGAGGIWRKYDATLLATPEAFQSHPGLVWQFYGYRRHMALGVQPNAAHYALAELARKKPSFLNLTQNVDGLSPRAGHDPKQIKYLHGSLFNIRCSSERCGYKDANNFVDPLVPALAIPTEERPALPVSPTSSMEAAKNSLAQKLHGKPKELDISDDKVKLAEISPKELPQCPQCRRLLRPDVVWFGEALDDEMLNEIDQFIDHDGVELMLVIGTSAVVQPAAAYVNQARSRGAKVAVINMDPETARGLRPGDWFFEGDASVIVPELFKEVIGELDIQQLQQS